MRSLRLLLLVGLTTLFITEQLFVSSQETFNTTDDLYLEARTSGGIPIDDEDGDDGGSGSGSGDYSFSNFTVSEEIPERFPNVSQTTVSTVTVPAQPEPTSVSPQDTSATATDSKDPSTRVMDTETTPFIPPNGNNGDEEVASPTTDWFTQSTSPNAPSMPPSETNATKFSIDITVIKDADEDNSLQTLDVSTPKNPGNKIMYEEVDNELGTGNERNSRMYDQDTPEEVTSENMWERTEVLAAVIACGVVGFLFAVFLLILLTYRMKKKDEGSYELADTKASTTAYQKAPTKEFYA
ncbi:syndecan-2-like [Sebastes umbrosus]|uniref:syndecan-2-like n=1 Tax=Sebastes umbrosus TaxID=72105 RepID=UPI0018A04B47|nr:syndecan-2-like [Sebastes umbrosus]